MYDVINEFKYIKLPRAALTGAGCMPFITILLTFNST